MPMRATTVRFDDSLWGMLEAEARLAGVSAAQFVRDATILRVASLAAQRGDEAATLTVEEVAAGALRAGRATASAEEAAAAPPADVRLAVEEPSRLRALEASGLLHGQIAPAFDRFARVAAKAIQAPVALVSVVDRDRQVLLGCIGLGEPWATTRETPLTHSFCQHAVASRRPLVVDDARRHPILRRNLAIRDLGVIAYAGVPLVTEEGHAVGSLCVIDDRPRAWTAGELDLLRDLADSVVGEIEARRLPD